MGVALEVTGYCFIVNVIAITGRVSLPSLLCPTSLGDSAHAILVKLPRSGILTRCDRPKQTVGLDYTRQSFSEIFPIVEGAMW